MGLETVRGVVTMLSNATPPYGLALKYDCLSFVEYFTLDFTTEGEERCLKCTAMCVEDSSIHRFGVHSTILVTDGYDVASLLICWLVSSRPGVPGFSPIMCGVAWSTWKFMDTLADHSGCYGLLNHEGSSDASEESVVMSPVLGVVNNGFLFEGAQFITAACIVPWIVTRSILNSEVSSCYTA